METRKTKRQAGIRSICSTYKIQTELTDLKESREERRMAAADAVGKAFGIIVVVLYFILGTTFIFFVPEGTMDQYTKPFGLLLYAYGLFRAYKYYRKYFAR